MAKIALTDRFIGSRKPAPKGKRIDYHDSVAPGLGLRISDTGRKVFYFRGRVPGQPDGRLTIGEYGAISLEAARAKAGTGRSCAEGGRTPRPRKPASAKLRPPQRPESTPTRSGPWLRRTSRRRRSDPIPRSRWSATATTWPATSEPSSSMTG